MTRSTPPKPVDAAERKSPAAAGPKPPSMTFRIDEDNGGRYHWMIVAGGGETLVRSSGFASYEEANEAAGTVHRGAARAVFADRPGDQSLDHTGEAACTGRRESLAGAAMSTRTRVEDAEQRRNPGPGGHGATPVAAQFGLSAAAPITTSGGKARP